MKTTIKDIAAAAGVSSATVSRVLSGRYKVSSDVRERVLHCARAQGYRVKTGSGSRVIAVIVQNGSRIDFEGYTSMICSVLSKEIFDRGYRMEIVPMRDIEILNERLICGAISLLFDNGIEATWNRNHSLPLVCVNTMSRHLDGIYSVCSDEAGGMKKAVELLHRHGHERIGMLVSNAENLNYCNRHRREGLINAMRELKMEPPPEFRYCMSPEKIYEPLGQLLHSGITGLICSGEGLSHAAAYALTIYGRRVPDDLSLIGYEFHWVSCFCLPRQTTLRQNLEELSRQAVNLLEQRMAGQTPAGDIVVDYQLIERETVAAAPVR